MLAIGMIQAAFTWAHAMLQQASKGLGYGALGLRV